MHTPLDTEAAAALVLNPEQFGPAGRLLMGVSKFYAAVGGLAFVALVIMSLISIVGRKLFAAPVPGDMEILMMVAATASATFFAYCHLDGGDVKIDFFTAHAGPRVVHGLDALGSLLVGLFGLLVAWRSWVGAMSLMDSGETSTVLGWPVWLAQAGMVPGFVLMGLAGLYMSFLHLQAARRAIRRAA
ncbi:MAG TPA: TRAP transporter small permease [Castellaniella sp.]|uniref:TRAP transporter small permease n=1 Tax=Castellaniella sp. TaxID=1955812 RepID=UPI002EE98D22